MLVYTSISLLMNHIDEFLLKNLNITIKGQYAFRLNNDMNFVNDNEEVIFSDTDFYYIRKHGEIQLEQTTNRQSSVLTFNTAIPIKFFFKFNRNGINRLNEEILYMNILQAINTFNSVKNAWIIPQSANIETFSAYFAEYGDESKTSLPDTASTFMLSIEALLTGVFTYTSCKELECC